MSYQQSAISLVANHFQKFGTPSETSPGGTPPAADE